MLFLHIFLLIVVQKKFVNTLKINVGHSGFEIIEFRFVTKYVETVT